MMSYKCLMATTTRGTRARKWDTALKADFRKKIENGKINPNRSDKEYIEEIRQRYYPDRTPKTFAGNWKTSIGEYRAGLVIAKANKAARDKGKLV